MIDFGLGTPGFKFQFSCVLTVTLGHYVTSLSLIYKMKVMSTSQVRFKEDTAHKFSSSVPGHGNDYYY